MTKTFLILTLAFAGSVTIGLTSLCLYLCAGAAWLADEIWQGWVAGWHHENPCAYK